MFGAPNWVRADFVEHEIEGQRLDGGGVSKVIVRVVSILSYAALKILAFQDRHENKDAYDLVFTLLNAPRRGDERFRDRRSGMPRSTANTITTIDGFRKELANVRANGYAVDDAENELDGRCVAVPLQGTRLPAAISLSAPAARFPAQDVPNVAAELMDIAHNIAAVSSGVQ